MSILDEIKKRAKQVGKSVKKNYGYYKLGRKTASEEKMNTYRNEMLKRAEKAGLYNPKKQKELDEKVKRGEAI